MSRLPALPALEVDAAHVGEVEPFDRVQPDDPRNGRMNASDCPLPYLRHSTRRFGSIGLLLYHPAE